MAASPSPPEQAAQKIILDNISWENYQRLLAERGERSQPRYAYDRGRLEIMVSSYEHENLKHDIATLVETIAEELKLDLVGAASTTFNREDAAQGSEPDACFYLEQAARIRGHKRIDLATDPPPDLVIEIDISSPSLNKFPIFAGLGVREVWRYNKQTLTICKLAGDAYQEQPTSEVLRPVTEVGQIDVGLVVNISRVGECSWDPAHLSSNHAQAIDEPIHGLICQRSKSRSQFRGIQDFADF